MTNLPSLLMDTGAYRVITGDKAADRLSHAYLIICADKENLYEYLKIFAKAIVCASARPCGECRACRLIDSGSFSDVITYPKKGDAVTVEDVNDLIEQSYLKPVEGNKKVFIISGGENMNPQAQNKLLKTLEEPPKGVHILIGSTTEYPLLSTVRSRTKRIDIPAFPAQKLIDALKEDCPDTQRLIEAVACGDGTVGRAKALYGDENLAKTIEVVTNTLCNMQSSKDVLEFSVNITNNKIELDQFITVTELMLRDMLVAVEGEKRLVANKRAWEAIKNAKGFNRASIVYALEKTAQAKKIKKANGGGTMLLEWLLFSILEGKHKWQKL